MTTYYTCGFYFSEDLEYVLLIEKARPDWQKGKYNGIGGHIESGEMPLSCQEREFAEETGCEERIAWDGTHSLVNVDDHIFFFRAMGPKFDVDEFFPGGDEKPRWVPVKEINNYNILPNLSWMIPMMISPCGVFDKFELVGYRDATSRWNYETTKK
jgi:8-oxo-dGTP diphosphatase